MRRIFQRLIVLGLSSICCRDALADIEVASCDDGIVDDVGFLTGDVDCLGRPLLMSNATLELRGFTLHGEGIICNRTTPCVVRGPGTIDGSVVEEYAASTKHSRIVLEDVNVVRTVQVNPPGCVETFGRVRVVNSTISGCYYGISARHAVLVGATLSGNDVGISAGRLKAYDSRIAGNRVGIEFGPTASLSNVVVEENSGSGIRALGYKLKARGGSILNNGRHGIEFESQVIDLREVSISGNGLSGLACTYGRKVRARDANISGNGVAPECAEPGAVCADLDLCELPQLSGSTCDRSHVAGNADPSATWGVCSLD